jgi:hypothetical protein
VELVDVRVKFDPPPPEVTSPLKVTDGMLTDLAVMVLGVLVDGGEPLTITKSPTATLGELTPG